MELCASLVSSTTTQGKASHSASGDPNAQKKEKGSNKPKPKVHKELSGFDISIDQFGEIRSPIVPSVPPKVDGQTPAKKSSKLPCCAPA